MIEALLHADQRLFLCLNSQLANPVLDSFFRFITEPKYFVWPLALVVVMILWKGNTRLRAAVLLGVTAVIISDALTQALRELIGRPRPFIALNDVRLLVGKSRSFSFPSGHAANMFAAATVLTAIFQRKFVGIILLAVAFLVAWSRIHVGVHYPIDVTAGAIIGAACGLAVFAVYSANRRPSDLMAYSLTGMTLDDELEIRQSAGAVSSSPDGVLADRPDGVLADRLFGISWFGLMILLMAILTVFRLAFIASRANELAPEEAYYWEWSRRLDWSCFSKPPMIAYIIWFFTSLGGSAEFFVRLGSVVLSVVMAVVTWPFARALGQSQRTAFFTILLLNVTPLFAVGAVLMTTDTPLMVFWALALWMVYLAMFREKRGAWLAAGIAIGLGLLSQYAMLFIVPCLGLFFLVSPPNRVWLHRVGLYIALLVALALFAPVIFWNWSRNWVTIHPVAADANIQAGMKLNPSELLFFLASQFGVIGPVTFALLLIITGHALTSGRRGLDAAARFLLCASLPIFAVCLVKSFQGKVQANWACPAYYTWLLYGIMAFENWREERRAAGRKWLPLIIALAAIFTSAAPAYMIHNTDTLGRFGIKLSKKNDPTARLKGWRVLGGRVSEIRKTMPHPERVFIFARDYQTAAELAFYTKGQPTTYLVNPGRRMSQHNFWPGMEQKDGWDAIFVREESDCGLNWIIISAFERCDPPEVIPITYKGDLLRTYEVFRCFGFNRLMAYSLTGFHIQSLPDRF